MSVGFWLCLFIIKLYSPKDNFKYKASFNLLFISSNVNVFVLLDISSDNSKY